MSMDIGKAKFYIDVMDELRLRHGIQSEVVPTDGPPGYEMEPHIRVTLGEHEIEFYHTCAGSVEPDLVCIQWVKDSDFLDGETWGTPSDWPPVFEVANKMREYFERAVTADLQGYDGD